MNAQDLNIKMKPTEVNGVRGYSVVEAGPLLIKDLIFRRPNHLYLDPIINSTFVYDVMPKDFNRLACAELCQRLNVSCVTSDEVDIKDFQQMVANGNYQSVDDQMELTEEIRLISVMKDQLGFDQEFAEMCKNMLDTVSDLRLDATSGLMVSKYSQEGF